jgi:hypothetical protein
MVTSSVVRLIKLTPRYLAAFTSAFSSGDDAWYTILSLYNDSRSGITVWQTAKSTSSF